MKWISVKDRLPKRVGNFLIHDIFGDVEAGFYNADMHWYNGGRPAAEVTHWMPLPEPPEGE